MSLSIGICLGATTISVAERTAEGLQYRRLAHDGRVAATLRQILDERPPTRLGITGRKFRHLVALPTVAEPEAVELAYAHLRHSYPNMEAIVSAGGETFLLYLLDAQGRICGVRSGNKCAAGTGEFFLQQIRRMELDIDQAVALAQSAEAYPVAGRCSVFCKSDCTHALNHGVEKGRITAGLCQMLAARITSLLQQTQVQRILLAGGVSRNRVVVEQLQQTFPNLHVPPNAACFEALGALLWAEHHGAETEGRSILAEARPSFESLPALAAILPRVHFKTLTRAVHDGGELLLGLDVGSTTTKAVLLRMTDNALVASCYLRTHGDPVGASRRCYQALLDQLPTHQPPMIVGLGVTGSGRQIAGLHALTPAVVNEIVAHAAAAVHFDPEVETIFEIGGQDAKYTFLSNRVACDYAMNEACSAGTGSFLEEACHESLGIATDEIAELALAAMEPPDFSDQCAAFISSDIKTAVQEGIGREDIAAGLVYAVCQNYLARVKGERPIGRKVFMQGGVCYNRAVPVAMAALCQRDIVVPPEPGLMGAFGVALDLKQKIEQGLLQRRHFDLAELAARRVSYREPFICRGGGDACDRNCSIARIVVDGKTHAFGGACSRYYNLLQDQGQPSAVNLVREREKLVLEDGRDIAESASGATIGIPLSLMTHSLLPFYETFFRNLGCRVLRGEQADSRGRERMGAAFCYPVELAYGLLEGLLQLEPDYLFLPHVLRMAVPGSEEVNCTCPLVQGEPYYLQATFRERLGNRVLAPVLDFSDARDLRRNLLEVARRLGVGRRRAEAALTAAREVLDQLGRQQAHLGRKFLHGLQPGETAVVLFGRPYNAFNSQANLGIPHKFASRGYKVLPHDCLPLVELDPGSEPGMYWGSGQTLLQAARFVAGHPQLFAAYISNFSCGPDSFILGRFRDIMGAKPSLLLELDAHSADTGIDTRIEAFIDVVRGYQSLPSQPAEQGHFAASRTLAGRRGPLIETGDGRRWSLTDPGVRLLLPSMGEHGTPCLAAAMRHYGLHVMAADPPGREELLRGRTVATCKECLPLHLTTGSFLKQLDRHSDEEGLTVLFMPRAQGPCRFGQYSRFLEHLIEKQRRSRVAVLALSDNNGYGGMPASFTRRCWLAINISDGLEDLHSAILALAAHPEAAMEIFRAGRQRLLEALEREPFGRVLEILGEEMERLAGCERVQPIEQAVKVSLNGEIYVRRDGFSRQNLVERLAAQGIVVRTAPVAEWLYYVDYCLGRGLAYRQTLVDRLLAHPRSLIMRRMERAVKARLRRSGFYDGHELDVGHLMRQGARLVHPRLLGEAILTVASTLSEIGDETHGVLSIGPFGCMPSRLAEAILTYRLSDEKAAFSHDNEAFWKACQGQLALPFLAIESDGNAFSQVVEARLETFILSVKRFKTELDRLHCLPRTDLSPSTA